MDASPAVPASPTPTAKALGGLVWLGGTLLLAGVLVKIKWVAQAYPWPVKIVRRVKGLWEFQAVMKEIYG